MNRHKRITVAMFLVMIAAMVVVMLAVALPAGDAIGQQRTQASDVERVEAASRSAVRCPCNRRFAPFARNPSQPSLIPAEPWDREWMRPTVEPALPVRGSAQKNSCPINRQQVHSG